MNNKRRRFKAWYDDRADYNTNAKSYYDDLARKNKLIKLLSERIWEYDEELAKRFAEWDKNLEEFDDEVLKLLQEWIDDGTFAHIINNEIFSWKVDKSEFNQRLSFIYVLKENDDLQEVLYRENDKIIYIPKKFNIVLNETVTIPDNTILTGDYPTITSNSQQTLFEVSSNTHISKLKLTSNRQFNYNDKAFSINGTVNDYVENVEIDQLMIENFGGYGVYVNFGKNVLITNTKIKGIGYAGVQTTSSDNVHIDSCHIEDIGSYATEKLCYGVSFTRNASSTDLSFLPKTTNSSVKNSTIKYVHTWEGLDTHGGENIVFDNNTIEECHVGIAVVSSHYNGVQDYAPKNVRVTNNLIKGTGKDSGITVAGSYEGDLSSGIIVDNNTVIEGGGSGNTSSGGLYVRHTLGAVISNNSFLRCFEGGISMQQFNKGFTIDGNTIIDTQSTDYIAAYGIGIRNDKYNEGIISNNSVILNNTNLNNYVLERGIFINGGDTNKIIIGTNYNTAKTQIHGSSFVESFIENDVKTLMNDRVIEKVNDIGRGYVKYENGFVLQWKHTTVDSTNTNIITVDFDIPLIRVGGGSISLNNTSSPLNIKTFNDLGHSLSVNQWSLRFAQVNEVTELPITLYVVGWWK